MTGEGKEAKRSRPTGQRPVVVPSPAELERSGRLLAEVLALAEAMPTTQAAKLTFPRLVPRRRS